ncbi:UNVERIFIED_CONTAM: hypothetical protein K2H54_048027 [Gekko kuhli]
MNPKLPYPPAFGSADALDLHNPYEGLVRVRSYCSAPVEQWERLRRSPKLRARGLRKLKTTTLAERMGHSGDEPSNDHESAHRRTPNRLNPLASPMMCPFS